MLPRLAAIVLILATLPASAAFMERHDHWTVALASQVACAAFNRPLEEFNAQPYAALSIRWRRGQGPRLQVFAWPDAFKAGDNATIEISVSATRVELPAQAPDTYYVEAREALPETLISELRETPLARFRIIGLPQIQTMMFDLSQLEAVMKSLDACMRQLRG